MKVIFSVDTFHSSSMTIMRYITYANCSRLMCSLKSIYQIHNFRQLVQHIFLMFKNHVHLKIDALRLIYSEPTYFYFCIPFQVLPKENVSSREKSNYFAELKRELSQRSETQFIALLYITIFVELGKKSFFFVRISLSIIYVI